MDRRCLLAALALAPLGRPALAAEMVGYRGFRLDISEEPERDGYRIVESLRHQVDIVADSGVKPEIMDFFRTIPIALRGALQSGFRVGPQIGLELAPVGWVATAPFVLRALLGAYFNRVLPADAKTALAPFQEQARTLAAADAAFPYLSAATLQTPVAFFAQTGSLYLCGTTESPPFERKVLEQKQPDYCAWLGRIFGVSK